MSEPIIGACEFLVETYGSQHQPEGTEERPLVTLGLLAYNQEQFIREALEGAFAQTYTPLEIILSDDNSIDRTFDVMKQFAINYSGPHSVLLIKNSSNIGVAAHFSRLLNLASGDYFVVAAGDDISLPNRVSTLVDLWALDKSLSFIDSAAIKIDQLGTPIEATDLILPGKVTLVDYLTSRVSGFNAATRGYRKKSQRVFKNLSPDCPTEDTTSLLRALMTGPGMLIRTALVKYRVHPKSLSGGHSLRRMNLSKIFEQYKQDLDKAITAGVLSIEEASLVEKWIRKTRAVRLINQKISNNQLDFFDLLRLLISGGIVGPGVALRITVRYLKAIFSSKSETDNF